MKVNKYQIMILLLLITGSSFLYLIELPGTFGMRTNTLIPLFFFLLGFFYVGCRYYHQLNQFWYFRYVIIVFFYLFFEVIYTWIAYPLEPKANALKECITYMWILGYFVLAWYTKNHLEKFVIMIIWIGTICAAIITFQAFLYNLAGITIFKIYGLSYGSIWIDIRGDRIRLLGEEYIPFTAVLSMGALFSKNILVKRKLLCLINIIMILVYEFYTAQTRFVMLILVISFICTLITADIKIRNYRKMMFVAAVTGIVLNLANIYNFVNGIISSETVYSYYHRVNEAKYFLECFFRNIIFGNGLLRNIPDYSGYFIIPHGNAGYGYSDIGLIGLIGKLGLCGVVMYFWLLYVFFKNLKVGNKINVLNLSIFTSTILSMATLSLFDAERMFLLIIFMAVYEGNTRMEIKKNENGNQRERNGRAFFSINSIKF